MRLRPHKVQFCFVQCLFSPFLFELHENGTLLIISCKPSSWQNADIQYFIITHKFRKQEIWRKMDLPALALSYPNLCVPRFTLLVPFLSPVQPTVVVSSDFPVSSPALYRLFSQQPEQAFQKNVISHCSAQRGFALLMGQRPNYLKRPFLSQLLPLLPGYRPFNLYCISLP